MFWVRLTGPGRAPRSEVFCVTRAGGAAHGFPGLRLFRSAASSTDAPSDFVSGLLFESEGLSEMWPELDEFEGADYHCALTQAIVEDGTTKSCVVYAVDVVE